MTMMLFWLLALQVPDSAAVEWIRVWFSQPGYGEAVSRYPGHFNCDLMDPLIARIDSARASVDLAAYDIENDRVVDALVRARARGVRVRIVTDNHMRKDSPFLDDPIWEKLRKAGIASIDDDGDVYWPDGSVSDNRKPNAGAQMHHKFAVFDRDTPAPDDDYVWTGSTNVTLTCVINTNTVVVIKDPAVARVYREEFEQMWGGSGSVPDPARAVFHKDKADVSQHRFYAGTTPLEVYFAPVDKARKKPSISSRLVELIEKEARHEITFGAFSISSGIPVSRALWAAADRPGVHVKGVIDRRFYARYQKQNDRWVSAEAKSGRRSVAGASELRILHSKNLLIDADSTRTGQTPILITGSYNFSNAAEFNNDENILIIRSSGLAPLFYADFQGVYRRALGLMETPAPKFEPARTYTVARVLDGGRFEVEVTHGFTYEVRLLGVDAPYVFPSADSVSAFAETSAAFLSLLLEGGQVSLSGPGGAPPAARNGAVYAYVTAGSGSNRQPVNRLVITSGMAKYSRFMPQAADSVLAYAALEEQARKRKTGIWADPGKWTARTARKPSRRTAVPADEPDMEPESPAGKININTATSEQLQELPRIGPSTAEKILEARRARGRFKSVDELGEIKGIGPKTLEQLRPLVTVDD